MATNQADRQKRTAVEHLSFGAKTAKRVAWEAWEFTVVGPHLVEVTNVSYGHLKSDHSYIVGVESRSSVALPAECDCPADIHHDPDCKHKVALACIGGETVLNASVNFETPAPASSDGNPMSAGEELRTDGGAATVSSEPERDTCLNGDPRCEGPDSDDLPCFACYCVREDEETRRG